MSRKCYTHAMKTKKQEPESRFVLRVPVALHEQLVELAKDEERSLNAQIVSLLRKAVNRNPK